MSILGWIIIGGLAGWIASKFVGTDAEQGIIGNIVAGVLGGIVGGFVFNLLGGKGVDGFSIWSFLVALVGAIIVLSIWKAITGRSKS